MKQAHNSAPVPRYQVFAMDDGEIVVQWTETRVQEITTGKYRELGSKSFGRRLNDAELRRLAEMKIIEQFNRSYIWLYSLPETGRYDGLNLKESNQPRFYYLNTTLSAEHLDEVRAALVESGLEDAGAEAHERDGVVAITADDGMLFPQLADAEEALQWVIERVPMLRDSAIAFANEPSFLGTHGQTDADDYIDLDQLIADQDAKHDSP